MCVLISVTRDDVKIRNHCEPDDVNKCRDVMRAIGGPSRRSSMAPSIAPSMATGLGFSPVLLVGLIHVHMKNRINNNNYMY